MKDFINELIEIGIGSAADVSNHRLVVEDVAYRVEMRKASELQDKLMDALSEEQQDVFEDYMEAIFAANERACNLTYLLGAKKVMEIFHSSSKEE